MSDNTPDIPTKQCTKCGAVHPAATEFWHKKRGGKYGLSSFCIFCDRERKRQWIAQNPEKARKNTRKWRRNNPEKLRAYSRIYNILNAERRREYARKWARDNPERVKERNRRWVVNNPQKMRIKSRNRDARKRNAEGSHTFAEVQEQLKRQRGKCYWCGCKLPKTGWHADHVIPLAKGGDNYISNIVCACASCNQKKNDKLPHEWDGTDRLL